MNLKKQLQLYLDLREMSASQLSRKAGVAKQSISGWLGGNIPRDVRQVKRCADILGTDLDNLLFGDGKNERSEKVTELDAILGNDWVSGAFEVRIRRIKK